MDNVNEISWTKARSFFTPVFFGKLHLSDLYSDCVKGSDHNVNITTEIQKHPYLSERQH